MSFFLGERVWSPGRGWGTVIRKWTDTELQLVVEFDQVTSSLGRVVSYTNEGSCAVGGYPVLFHEEIPLEDWPSPPRPNLDLPVEVTPRKGLPPVTLKYSHYNATKDVHFVFPKGKDSKSATSRIAVYYIDEEQLCPRNGERNVNQNSTQS